MTDKKTAKEELRRRIAEEQRIRDEDALDPAKLAVDDLVGRREWRRSKFSYLTGIGAIKDGIGSVSELGKGSRGRVEDIGKAAFAQDKRGRAISQDIVDSNDRFRASMQANNRSLAHVNKSVANTYRHFWFYIGLMGLTLALGLVTFVIYGFYIPSFPLFDILFRLVPLPVLGALALRSSYTNWMFRKRRLDTLDVYLRSGQLLPRKPAIKVAGVPAARRDGTEMTKSNTMKALVLFAGMAISLLSFGSQPVEASQPGGPADPGQQIFADPDEGTTDKFIQMLTYIIPGVGPIPEGEPSAVTNPQYEATKTAFMAFSGTLLFLAAMVSGWQIITGLVASAKEGTVLGKQYHEVWAPIRVVFGFGMLAPIAGGLCAAQIICLYLVVWGGNLANIVWTPYIQSVAISSTPNSGDMARETISAANLPIANASIRSVFEKELCWHIVKNSFEQANYGQQMLASGSINLSNTSGGQGPQSPVWEKSSSIFASSWFATDYDSWKVNYGLTCGMLEVRIPRELAESETNQQWRNDRRIEIAMANKQLEALGWIRVKVVPKAKEAAQTYMNTDGSSPRYFDPANAEESSKLFSMINDMRTTYVKTMLDGANETLVANTGANGSASVKDYSDKAVADGWSAAGAYYVSIGRLQSMVYSTSTKAASFSTDTIFTTTAIGNSASFLKSYLYGEEANPGGLAQFQAWWTSNFDAISPEVASDIMTIADQTGGLGDMLDPLFIGASRLLISEEHINPLNPMQNMIDLGNRMMLAGSGYYVAAAAAGGFATGGASGAASVPLFGFITGAAAGGFAGVVSAVTALASMAAIAVIAAGAVHAFVIPMIPYVMTAFFVGGMALLTAEALVAAPLWAFFHIRMDGDSFISEVQKPGYMIAFNLLLRPALMIFGLILSYLVFGAMAWFVENTFYGAATSLSGSTSIGPLGAIVLLIIVTYIHFQMAVRAFGMILQVPDRVTRWFGQGGERLGEEEDTNKATAFLVSQSTNKLEGLGRGASLGGRGGGRKTGAEDGSKDAGKLPAGGDKPAPPAGEGGGGGKSGGSSA